MAETRTYGGYTYTKQDDGSWKRGAATPQGVQVSPGNPYAEPKAAADAARAQAESTVATSTVEAEIRKANAQAAAAQAEANRIIAESNNGGRLTPGQQKADEAFATDYAAWTAGGGMAGLENKLRVLDEALTTIEGSDTITGPVFGRLPKFIQQMVDPRSQDVRADVEKAIQETLRQTLGAQFTAKEGEAILARTFDPTQQEGSNARRMRNLIEELRSQGVAKDSAAQYFQQNGTITGWTPPRAGELPNAMNTARLSSGGGLQAAGAGATTQAVPLPPEMQQEHAAFLQQWMSNPDPQAYAQFRTELDRKYGYQGDPQEYLSGGQRMAEGIASGRTISADIPPVEETMTTGAFSEQARNDAVNNPVAAALVGAADMGSFGGVRAVFGDDLNALSQAQPLPMLAGQMAGAIGGVGALGRASRFLAERAPGGARLLGGGGKAQFGRNVAADTAYSGTYGGVSGEGAGQDALLGGIGSIAGQGVGRGLGAAIGGANLAPAVEALRARNIPMTMGQKLGGFAKSVEDKATSMPLVGDMIAARRMEGLQSFNREAMREAGSPIGFNPGEIGREGIDQMVDAVGNSYDQATAGANVPFDGDFITDMGRFGQAANALPRDFRVKAARAIENRIAPLTDTGAMTGEQYQQAIRGLKGYKAETSKPGFEQDYRDALTIAQDALTEQMRRGGGEQVVEGLGRADQAYRGIKTVEDAAMRADGAGYMFTPSQLQDALKKTQRKFPGRSPLNELADTGQEVLPSTIPDSGTAGRAAQMLMGGGLIGAGTGAGALAGGGEGAQTGALSSAALAALLMLGGTRGGQRALDLATISRPPAAKQLGQGIRKRKGLFGSATLPLLIAN